MIDIMHALRWLNWGKKTEIPDQTRFWIDRVANPGLNEIEKKDIIEILTRTVVNRKHALEQAEILVHCSAYGYELNMIEEAFGWLQSADRLYEPFHDIHRQAVVSWMLFIVQRALGKYQHAFDQARKARRLFSELADEQFVRKQAEEESWYRGRILDMTCDLVSSPEDVFEWMFEFHGSLLCASSAQIKSRLAEYLERRDFDRAANSMQLLLGISMKSLDPMEAGEALAYCGVINWVLENRIEAVQFLRSALAQYIPESHEHVLVRWMLGLALIGTPAARHEAIKHMETSIEHIDRLRQAAIHKNRLQERDWYAIHHIAMMRVLRTWVSDSI